MHTGQLAVETKRKALLTFTAEEGLLYVWLQRNLRQKHATESTDYRMP